MRERHADTVRFHKSHRPKMTVVRFVIGLLLLVFPTQLTAVDTNVGFSYVIDLRNEPYAIINFYRTSTNFNTPIGENEYYSISGSTNDSPVYLRIETNLSNTDVKLIAGQFSCDGLAGVHPSYKLAVKPFGSSNPSSDEVHSPAFSQNHELTLNIGTGSVETYTYTISYSFEEDPSHIYPADSVFVSDLTVVVEVD